MKDIAKTLPTPSDWCYVHNFDNEYEPNTLRCPPGMGKELKEDMKDLIDAARISIRQLFEGEDYTAKREEMSRKVNAKRDDVIARMSQAAQEEGFVLQLTAIGLTLVPVIKGHPLKDEEFLALSKEAQQKLAQQRETLREKLKPLMHELREVETTARNEIGEFDRDVALYAIDHLMSNLLDKYKAHEEIT